MKYKRTCTIAATLLAALALIATACGDDSESTSTDAGSGDAGVAVDQPWSRATAPSATTAAVYMTLTADTDDDLVGASVDSSIADTAQLHEVVAAGDMDDGDHEMDDSDTDHEGTEESSLGASVRSVSLSDTDSESDHDGDDMDEMEHEGTEGMTMQEVTEIPLPAGEAVVLEPGGYHIMMTELAAPLEAGETFQIELQFATAGIQTVTVEVQEV